MGTQYFAVGPDKLHAVALGKQIHSEVRDKKFANALELKDGLLKNMEYKYGDGGWNGDIKGYTRWLDTVVSLLWSIGTPFEVVSEHNSGVPYKHTTIIASVLADDEYVGKRLGWQLDTSCMCRGDTNGGFGIDPNA